MSIEFSIYQCVAEESWTSELTPELWPLSSDWTPLFVLLRSLWHRQNTIWYSTTHILWVSSFERCWWTPISLWWGLLDNGMYQPCLFPADEAHSQGVTLSQHRRLWVWVHCSVTTHGQCLSHTSWWATTSQFVPTSSPTSHALVEFVAPSARFGHSCFPLHVGLQYIYINIYHHFSVSLQAVISIPRCYFALHSYRPTLLDQLWALISLLSKGSSTPLSQSSHTLWDFLV